MKRQTGFPLQKLQKCCSLEGPVLLNTEPIPHNKMYLNVDAHFIIMNKHSNPVIKYQFSRSKFYDILVVIMKCEAVHTWDISLFIQRANFLFICSPILAVANGKSMEVWGK